MQVNIYDAKTRLSDLIERAITGEDVVIARSGKPMVRLTPVNGKTAGNGVRLGGLKGARVRLAPDFHAPMSDADLLGK